MRFPMAIWLAILLTACGSNEGNEARLLLDRIDGLGTPDLQERRQRLEAIRHMPLRSERASALRDACVPMQAALLEADEAAVLAAAATDAREAGDLEAGPRAIEAIARGHNAVNEVQRLQQACQDKLTSFRAHFAPSNES